MSQAKFTSINHPENGMSQRIAVMCVAALVFALGLSGVAHAATPLLINGELDQWQGGSPTGWTVLDGVTAGRDTSMRVSGVAAARLHPNRDQQAAHNNSIIEQIVTLEPNTTYRLSFWTAKDASGDVRAYVVAQDGSGIVLEYISGWANFFVWTPIECTFQTNNATSYAVRLVQYGYPNEPVWFDRAKLERVPEPGEKSSAPESAVNLYSQSTLIPFDESAPDTSAIWTDQFSVQKAGNEYEACLVAMQAGRDLSQVDLRLTGDLISRNGTPLSAEHVEIRSYEAGVLPLTRPRDIAAGRCAAWWITVKPTPDLAPGLYAGTFELVSDGQVVGKANLVVDLLDITLPTQDASFFVWHSNYYFPPEYLTDELIKAYYKDMAEHGMTTVTIYNTATDGQNVDFTRNHMLLESDYPRFSQWGFDKTVQAILDAGLCQGGQPLLLLTSAQAGPAVGKEYGQAMLQNILAEWNSREGWPKPIFYVSDEPSTQERIDKVKPILEKIRSYPFAVTTTTAGLDIPQLGSLYDLWIMAESEIDWEHKEKAREHGAELWTYNCTVPFTNAPFNRAFYGFWAYRTGLKGFGRWAYHDDRKQIMDEAGVVHGAATGARLSHVIASADGPVPTVGWEAAREGIDDYRLMMLYDELYEQASQKLTALEAQYVELLSEDDISLLTQIDNRQFTKQKEGEASLTWSADTDQQKQGAQTLRQALALKRELQIAKYARVKVFESIPAGAMGIRATVPFSSQSETLYPALGAGDQRTVTEVKRRILLGYFTRLRKAMNL